MKLTLMTASEVVIEDEMTRLRAEAPGGGYTILPRHIDMAALQVPGLISLNRPGRETEWVAVDEGIVVKQADHVWVAVRDAVRGGSLEDLERAVEERFLHVDEQEKRARAAAARLEADFVRRYLEVHEGV